MSDQSPSGSPEPGPADPPAPTGPVESSGSAVPAQPTGPAPSDQPTATGPPGSGQFAAPGPVVPGQPGASGPVSPGQPVAPSPWDPAAVQPQGWVFPPTGGFPPGADPYAGFPPGYPPYGGHLPYGWPTEGGFDPADPLVNPPYAGVNGWFARCAGALRRSWRTLVPLMLLTQALPAAVISIVSLGLEPSPQLESMPADGSLPEGYLGDSVTFASSMVVAVLLLYLVQSVGWAAGTWVVTRQAAGEPADLGGALRYGLRRAPGLYAWTLLIGVIVTVGLCFCVLPGVYLAFALALAGPVYLFERQNPIGRSFRFFHDRLGMVLGRVGLVAVALLVGGVVGAVLEAVGTAPLGTDPFAAPGSAAVAVAVVALAAVLVVPVYLVQLVGLIVTYAEQRAHEAPVNAARLAAELG